MVPPWAYQDCPWVCREKILLWDMRKEVLHDGSRAKAHGWWVFTAHIFSIISLPHHFLFLRLVQAPPLNMASASCGINTRLLAKTFSPVGCTPYSFLHSHWYPCLQLRAQSGVKSSKCSYWETVDVGPWCSKCQLLQWELVPWPAFLVLKRHISPCMVWHSGWLCLYRYLGNVSRGIPSYTTAQSVASCRLGHRTRYGTPKCRTQRGRSSGMLYPASGHGFTFPDVGEEQGTWHLHLNLILLKLDGLPCLSSCLCMKL